MNAGIYLKGMLLETLSKYKVHPKQLYTITSDNCAKMVKGIELVEKAALKKPSNEEESMPSSSREKTNSFSVNDTFNSDNDR